MNRPEKPKRVDGPRQLTEFRDGKDRLCVARDCERCWGKDKECPACSGVGILIERVTTVREHARHLPPRR